MLVFECVTIVMTQRGIISAGVLQAKAIDSRTSQLEASIAAQRAAATALRENGAKSGQSQYIGARDTGAASVRQSLAAEQRLAKQADTLAEVQAQRKPTTTELLGEDGALYYAVARGILVSVAGLVFFGAAGALVRAARNAPAAGAGAAELATTPSAAPPAVVPVPAAALPAAANDASPPVPGASVFRVNPGRVSAWAALPVAALAAATMNPSPAQASTPQRSAHNQAQGQSGAASAAPSASTEIQHAQSVAKAEHPGVAKREHPGDVPHLEPLPAEPQQATSAAPAEPPSKAKKARRSLSVPGVKVDTGVGERDGARYQRVKAGVLAGSIRPSVRGIQAAEGGSIKTVSGYLAELAREGVTHRHGLRWKLSQEVAA